MIVSNLKRKKAEEIVYEILLVVIFVTDPLRCARVSHDHFCVFENKMAKTPCGRKIICYECISSKSSNKFHNEDYRA